MEHLYDESEAIVDQIDMRLVEIQNDAMRLKDQALVWVYAIEWFSVTATSMIAGSFLWFVMIRRRLYREIGTTRISDSGD